MDNLTIDLNSDSSRRADYVNLIESNAFSSLITQPTRVTADLQTIIDHILTSDNESVITQGVFLYKLADHYTIYWSITNPKFKNTVLITLEIRTPFAIIVPLMALNSVLT